MKVYVAELLTKDTFKQTGFFTNKENAELCCAYKNTVENRKGSDQWYVAEIVEDKTDYHKLIKQLQAEIAIEEQKKYFSRGI